MNRVRVASRRDRREGREGRKQGRREAKHNFYVVGIAHLTSYSAWAMSVTRPLEL